MYSVKLLRSDTSQHSKRSDKTTVKKTKTKAQSGPDKFHLSWHIYKIGVDCKYYLQHAQKLHAIAQIRCF